jgi:hypothetical protein
MKGYNFRPAMFLLELGTQCSIARACYERLRDAASAWYTNATNEQFGNAMAPREIIVNCVAFLSAVAAISKLIFAGRRENQEVTRRCKRLQELLGISDLPILRKLAVRNSFEHVDERLDTLLSSLTSGSINPISVTERPPPAGTIVLKRFDPKKLSISFTNDTISLEESMREVEQLESRIDLACKQLQGPEFKW